MIEDGVDRRWGLAIAAGSAPAAFVLIGALPLLLIAGELVEPLRALGPWAWGLAFISILAAFATSALAMLAAAGFRVPVAAPVLTACAPWLVGLVAVAMGTNEAAAAVVHASPEHTSQLLAAATGAILPARALGGWFSGALLAGVALGLGIGALARRAPDRSVAGAAVGGLAGLALLGVAAAGAIPPMLVKVSDNSGLLLPALVGAVAVCIAAASTGNDADKPRSPGMGMGAAAAAGLALSATAAGLSSLSISVAANALQVATPDTVLPILARAITAASASDPVVLYAGGVGLLGLLVMAVWSTVRAGNPKSTALAGLSVGLVALVTVGADLAATTNMVSSMTPNPESLYEPLPGFEPVEFASGGSTGPAWIAVDDEHAVASGAPGFGVAGDPAPPTPTTLKDAFEVVRPLDPAAGLPGKASPAVFVAKARGPEAQPDVPIAVHRDCSKERIHEILQAAEDAGLKSLLLVGRPTELKDAREMLEFRLSRHLVPGTRGVRIFLGSSLPKPSVDHDEDPETVWQGKVTASGPVDLVDTHADARKLQMDIGARPPRDGERRHALVLLEDDVTAQRLANVAAHFDQAGIDIVVLREPLPSQRLVPAKGPGQGDGTVFGGGLGTLGNLAGQPVKGLPAGAGGEKSIVLGALSKPVIQSVIRKKLPSVKRCYERQLQVSPQLAGRVVVKLVISASGAVSSAEVKSSTLSNEKVGECITGVLRRARFPEPKGGGIVVVSYPFVFKPSP